MLAALASTVKSPASNPFGYPASARSFFARARSYCGGGGAQKKSKVLGIIEFVSNECPSVSAWLIACRSIARLAARRTRRSVGFEISVARPASAPRRQPRDRPAGDQPGRDARTLVAYELDYSQHLRLLLGAASSAVRSRPREEAPRRGRISERIGRR